MQIFMTDLQIPPDVAQALTDALPSSHAHRASNLAATVAYHLVRYAIRQLSPDADAEHWAYGEHGKPHLVSGIPYFNLSHSRHGVAVAVSADCEIGIDLEEIRAHHSRLAKRYCTDAERAQIENSGDPTSELIRIWTAKEAAAKQAGIGIDRDFRNIPVNGVKSARIELKKNFHWLSVFPASEMPEIEQITAEKLLQST